MSIVTLSGLTGGGARRLGPGIARRLGADYVDRLILTDAARHVGATVAALHEREERPPTRGERFTGMLQRILERAAVSGAAGDPYFGPSAVSLLTDEFEELPQSTITRGHEIEDEKYHDALSQVINDLAATGSVVIVGRGSPVILKDTPTALRVGTVADWDDRVARVMDVDRLERDEAERTIIARDQARAYYYKRYFNIDDPDDPKLYHFVLNTSDLGIEYATSIVIEAAQALEAGHIRSADGNAP
jgi:cytidylate kinase